MPADPKVQLTRLALGIAGVAAVAGITGRFVNGPAQMGAAVAKETGTAEQAPALEAAPQNRFSWFGANDDDDDDDDEDHAERERKEAESHGRREGRLQFAQPGKTGATGAVQQQQLRSRSRHS